MANNYYARKVHTANGVYDSKFEYQMSQVFSGLKHHPPITVEYVTKHKYNPDFITPTGHLIETKGYMPTEDRSKYKALKLQNPNIKLVFVFSNPKETISKESRTTYMEWAEKLGFEAYTIDTFPARKFGLVNNTKL